METIAARVVSVHVGAASELGKDATAHIDVELDGIVGANLCVAGVSQFSRLPKGSLLQFPSGAELIVEEFNHPCHDMGKAIAEAYATRSGRPLESTAFSRAAKLTRGLVGVVEVAGRINAGDQITVQVYEPPSWLERAAD